MTYRVLVAVFLIACGGGSDSTTDAPAGDSGGGGDGDFTITTSPVTLFVPLMGSGTATITVTRTGDVGDVMLSASNLPTGMSVAFATNPLPAAESTTEATVTLGAGATTGTNEITITGTAGATSHTTTLSVTSEPLTVTGRIAGNRPNIIVRIPGKAAVTSDASGNFTFTDVTPPYDIYTYASVTRSLGGPQYPSVIYYENLTRPDPVLFAPVSPTFITPTLTSSGTVTGNKNGTGDLVSPLWIGIGDVGSTTAVGDVGQFSFNGTWPFANTRNTTLYGLQWTTGANGAPNAYLGYVAKPVTLNANVSNNTGTLTFAALPTTAALTGTITKPTGFSTPALEVVQQLGTNDFSLYQGTTATVSATIPVVADGRSTLYARSFLGASTSEVVFPGLTAATDATFTMPAPAVLVLPAASATAVTTTSTFEFVAPQNAVHELRVVTDGTTKASYMIYTTATMTTIPDVPEVPLPTGQSFTWAVGGYGPVVSIDDAAVEGAIEGVSVFDFTGPLHFETQSLGRTFTSQ